MTYLSAVLSNGTALLVSQPPIRIKEEKYIPYLYYNDILPLLLKKLILFWAVDTIKIHEPQHKKNYTKHRVDLPNSIEFPITAIRSLFAIGALTRKVIL